MYLCKYCTLHHLSYVKCLIKLSYEDFESINWPRNDAISIKMRKYVNNSVKHYMVKQIAIKLTFGCGHGLYINHSHVYMYMSLSITVNSNQNWFCLNITYVNTSLIWILVAIYAYIIAQERVLCVIGAWYLRASVYISGKVQMPVL